MSFVKDKSGFSLIEITIAMGLATGLLLFYMKMQSEQAKKALTAKVNTEIESFFTDFRGTITRPGFCIKSFENSTMPDNSATLIQSIKSPRGDVRYQVGEAYGGKTLKLNSIILKNFRPDDKEGLEGIAVLELDIEKIGNIYGSKKIKKSMEVSVSRDESKKIVGCGSLGSGGININITAPVATPAPTGTTPATSPGTTNTPQTAPTTSIPSSPSADEQQKQLMIELEKNPEFKKIQESLKKMKETKDIPEDDVDF